MRRIILAETTPNPDALRFLPGVRLLESGAFEFDSADSADTRSPLAAQLFALGDVCRVFIAKDFVAVTKRPGADWRLLGPRVQQAIRVHLETATPAVVGASETAGSPASGPQAELIERLLAEITPYVASHGGGVELVRYAEGVLDLRLRGACVGCARASETLREGIERRLRPLLPDLVEVRALR